MQEYVLQCQIDFHPFLFVFTAATAQTKMMMKSY